MKSVIESARSGRATCRKCKEPLPKGELRFGMEAQTARGTTMQWYHLACAAKTKKVAARFIEDLSAYEGEVPDRAAWIEAATALLPESKKTKATKAKPAAEVVPFGDYDAKALASIAQAVDRRLDLDGYIDPIFERLKVPYEQHAGVVWHLARTGLVDVAKHAGLLVALRGNRPAEAGWYVEVLARIPAKTRAMYRHAYEHHELLTGWTREIHEFALEALLHDGEGVRAGMKSFAPNVRRGILFLRGLGGEALSDSEKASVLEELAKHAAREGTITTTSLSFLQDGERKQLHPHQASHLETIASRFGTQDQWEAVLVASLAKANWKRLEVAVPYLRTVPLEALTAALEKRNLGLHSHFATIFHLLQSRSDSADALAAHAATLAPAPDYAMRELGNLLIVLALEQRLRVDGMFDAALFERLKLHPLGRAYEALGEPEPNTAPALLRPICDRIFAAAPEVLIRQKIDEAIAARRPFDAMPLVLYIDDDDVFPRLLRVERSGTVHIPIVVELGDRAIDPVLELAREVGWPASPGMGSTLATHLYGLLVALSHREGPLSEAELRAAEAIVPRAADLAPSAYSALHDRYLAFLRRLPAPLRQGFIEGVAGSARHGAALRFLETVPGDYAFHWTIAARVLATAGPKPTEELIRLLRPEDADLMAAVVGDAPLTSSQEKALAAGLGHAFASFMERRSAAPRSWLDLLRGQLREAAGETETVYVLEPEYRLEGVESPRTPESWSTLGGSGPGIDAPRRADGDPMDHVLTLDLGDAPLLESLYPGARALAVYVPDRRSGEGYGKSRIVPVPPSAERPSGAPLHVFAVQVPTATFERDGSTLRGALLERGGFVLGAPLWIQDEEHARGRFVMQLSEPMGLNCGDAGSVYFFEQSTHFQCH